MPLKAYTEMNKNDEFKWPYDPYEKAELDYISGIRAAEKKARMEGILEGIAEARMEETLRIAKKAVLMGLSVDLISKVTSLDIEVIKSLN
jgi:predicted transposase YdaD